MGLEIGDEGEFREGGGGEEASGQRVDCGWAEDWKPVSCPVGVW